MPPAAFRTPGTFRTPREQRSENAGRSWVSSCAVVLAETATSVPCSDSSKISSNDWLIVSVRT